MSINFSLEIQSVVTYMDHDEDFLNTMVQFDLGNSSGYRKICPANSDCAGRLTILGGKEAALSWLLEMRLWISDSRLTGAIAYILTMPESSENERRVCDGNTRYGYNYIVSWG